MPDDTMTINDQKRLCALIEACGREINDIEKFKSVVLASCLKECNDSTDAFFSYEPMISEDDIPYCLDLEKDIKSLEKYRLISLNRRHNQQGNLYDERRYLTKHGLRIALHTITSMDYDDLNSLRGLASRIMG